MTLILIFTNEEKLAELKRSLPAANDAWNDALKTIKQNHVLRYCRSADGSPGLKESSSLSEEGIYLIYDSIPVNEMDALLAGTHYDKLYALVHTNSQTIHTDYFEHRANCCSLSGSHSTNDSHHYYPAFRILFDSGGDEMGRLVNNVFNWTLECVCRFLKGCLDPSENVDSFFYDYYEALSESPDVGSTVQSFYEDYYSQKESGTFTGSQSDYDDALTNLRDILIEYALSKKV